MVVDGGLGVEVVRCAGVMTFSCSIRSISVCGSIEKCKKQRNNREVKYKDISRTRKINNIVKSTEICADN